MGIDPMSTVALSTKTPSSQTLTLPSPAKLNLFLHINGRRADGYHELQTLFQFLDYGDSLSFSPLDKGNICLAPSLPNVADEDNLIVKAARKLQQVTGCQSGAKIGVEKRLPMGGGIGGGSSNAATALHGLNKLWSLNLSIDELAEIGLSLGADVPVFVRGEAAFAEGVGEKLTPVKLKEPWYVVLTPNCHVSTAEVFSSAHLPRNTPKLQQIPSDPWLMQNDCQKLVCQNYPAVEKALLWLLEYAPARMTGTGSCVFAQFDTQNQAQACLAAAKDFQGFVAKGENYSPLLKCLND
jgi:4-diphosphocytidyl-2-C-methyl-D-erythritol kinase